jgi:hypothetical protein
LLPPGSLAAPIQRVRVLHAPSLESFLVDVLLAPGGARWWGEGGEERLGAQ